MAKKSNGTQKLVVFYGNSYFYGTRIIVNGCYWNTCKGLCLHGYPDPY